MAKNATKTLLKQINKELTKDRKQRDKLKEQLDNRPKYKYNDSGLQAEYEKWNTQYTDMADNPQNYGYDKYIDNVNDLYGQIMSQSEFSYDPTKDALFQMYKQQYDKQGTQAMRNAMGVGTARTGGYNSSAAQTAAQTTYLGYMDALNDKVADTYQNALSRYQQGQQNLMNQYNMARDLNNSANDAYWQQLGVASQRANNALSMWNADDDRQYRSYTDTWDRTQQMFDSLQNSINNNRMRKLQLKGYTG